jgi:putative transposase
MAMGPPMKPLLFTDDDRKQLQEMAKTRTMPHSLVVRAQIILACSNGEANNDIADRLGLSGMTVGKWRKRYLDQGI